MRNYFVSSIKRCFMDLLVSIGEKIQKLREKRGITQEQLEEKTGINAKYISSIECGQKNVTILTLEKIAKSLDVELFELLVLPKDLESEDIARKAKTYQLWEMPALQKPSFSW